MPTTPLSDFLVTIKTSVSNGSFLRATLGKSTSELFPEKVLITPIVVKGEPRFQFVERFSTRDTTTHWAPQEALEKMTAWIGKRFLCATVFTTSADFSIDHNRRGEARFLSSRPTEKSSKNSHQENSPVCQRDQKSPTTENEENSKKLSTKIDPSWPWLRDLGLLNGEGKITAGKERKWRQVEKFLETFDALLRESKLTEQPEIRVIDMGSGMGYLTFALFAHLERVTPGKARVTGIESRPDLVKNCKSIAQKYHLDRLIFQEGRIGEKTHGMFDVLVALHACDTATDDALFAAVQGGAKIILSVPCCHKQIRSQIQCESSWGKVLDFGILAERQAEMVTDGLRAKLLESQGYRVNVAEFISAEHTAKNVLITGVFKGANPHRTDILAQITDIKKQFGIQEQKLEKLLQEKDLK